MKKTNKKLFNKKEERKKLAVESISFYSEKNLFSLQRNT